MFVTSSNEESTDLTNLMTAIKLNDNQIQFIPKEKGMHGSKALWENNPDNGEYWDALNKFLDNFKN